jgi:pimeloyl-ACP methyl ester carboxylesterase
MPTYVHFDNFPARSHTELYEQGYHVHLTNRSIGGAIAQQQNGSAIMLEHRFYGLSNPYPDLTVKSLKFHTLQQAIDDMVYFAQKVKLPQPDGDKVTPDKAPWVLVGGSYSGALTSWIMVK